MNTRSIKDIKDMLRRTRERAAKQHARHCRGMRERVARDQTLPNYGWEGRPTRRKLPPPGETPRDIPSSPATASELADWITLNGEPLTARSVAKHVTEGAVFEHLDGPHVVLEVVGSRLSDTRNKVNLYMVLPYHDW